MAYTNLNLYGHGYYEENKQLYLAKAEISYYKKLCGELIEKLQNIPDAIKKYGYVDISYEKLDKKETIRLIESKND